MEREITEADQMAALVYGLLFEAHPTYANTTGWRGGVGGSALTQGCSVIDGRPDHEEPLEQTERIFRQYLRDHPNTDVHAILKSMGVRY